MRVATINPRLIYYVWATELARSIKERAAKGMLPPPKQHALSRHGIRRTTRTVEKHRDSNHYFHLETKGRGRGENGKGENDTYIEGTRADMMGAKIMEILRDLHSKLIQNVINFL